MQRIVKNKAKTKKCEFCEKEISLYGFSAHLKFEHKIEIDGYIEKFGEFRKSKLEKEPKRKINKIECKICNKEFSTVGMFTHLRDAHKISKEDYISKFGEYNPKTKKLNCVDAGDDIGEFVCLVDNKQFKTCRQLYGYIKREYKIESYEYILKHVFAGINPTCKCGCGKDVKLTLKQPFKVDYVAGHNSIGENNPMYGKIHGMDVKKKMSDIKIEYLMDETNVNNKKNTEPELKFKRFLESINEPYQQQYKIDGVGVIDFYLPKQNLFVEIDGVYWHPDINETVDIMRVSAIISAKRKSTIKNIIRIKETEIDKISCIDDILNVSYIPTFKLNYFTKIITKQFFKKYIELKNKAELKNHVFKLVNFIKTIQPEFPDIESVENINDVLLKLKNIKLDSIIVGNEFLNTHVPRYGHSFIRSHFKSYWKSKFENGISPIDCWKDNKILHEIISYRIGCNDSNEIFDFSLHDIVKGIQARRISISIFSPGLAASIYKRYLGEFASPTVLDPCAGFGGRLIGFKSMYPSGKYIGCEPNVETYNELCKLVTESNMDNVELYNCKFEDYIGTKDVDLTFTSIPYFNLEKYSNPIEYENFDIWKNTFIKSIELCKNCYINCSEDIGLKLKWKIIDSYITNNRSHFDNRLGFKKEPIYKVSNIF